MTKLTTWLSVGYVAVLAGRSLAAARSSSCVPAATVPGLAELRSVLVAQPILSGDPQLGEALEANVQELVPARFVWLVDHGDVVARSVAARIIEQHPDARIEVMTCAVAPDGVNPKLWKLALVEPLLTRSDVLVVLDDDTRLPLPSLGALLSALRVGTVSTGLPAYLDRGPWQARLVGQFVNNNAALTYLSLLPVLAPITLNGMGYAIRAADLTRLGGFTPLQHHLTDDLAVASLIRGAHEQIVQTAAPLWVSTSVDSTAQYVSLMHRWFLFAGILLRSQRVGTAATIVAAHGSPPVLLWAALTSAALRPSGRAALSVAGLLASRAAILTALQRGVYGRSLHRPVVSLAAELAQPLHMVHGTLWRTIRWRSRRYRVVDDTSFRAL